MPSRKPNCWEALKCGREPGGTNAKEKGTCPAAIDKVFDGFNQGVGGGRLCWLVAGTFCGEEVQGTFAKKQTSCRNCSFYKQVHAEEGTAKISEASIKAFAISHKGPVLTYNDDRYFMKILEDGSILVGIADGLGGAVSGDYAAEIMTGRLAGMHAVERGFELEQLTAFALESDQAIFKESQKHPDLSAMGTTLLCTVIRGEHVYWVHAGDSRLYRFHESDLLQITEDQTLARFLVSEGEISADQVPVHYSRNVMDQYIGCGFCEPESGSLEWAPNDLLIFSTDGLHKAVPEKKMIEILKKKRGFETKARSMIEVALEKSEGDNMTLVLAEFDPE